MLPQGLANYFHNEMDLEKAFELLDKMEEEYVRKIDSIYDKYELCFDIDVYGYQKCTSTKAYVCRDLLSQGEEIYHLYPEKDARGEFEVDYNAVRLWEEARFGKIVDSHFVGSYEFCTYKIDKEQEDYKQYRKKLYAKTIDKICEKYSDYIYSQLSDEQKELVRSYINGENKVCEKDDSYMCPDKGNHTSCIGCPLGDAIDNRYPQDDC